MLTNFFTELVLKFIDFRFMLSGDLDDHHLIIALAAIFQQDLEYFPEAWQDWVFMFGVGYTFHYHFIETYRVDEQTTVDSFDIANL